MGAKISKGLMEHEEAGRFFKAAGVNSFVLEEGEGEPVICVHGVPSSSYLYRKVVPKLAENGYRGIAIDFPGLGLAERPEHFDYSWTGLGTWLTEAITELVGPSEKFHMIIHDIGGPIGMEVAAAHPERILSLTILNTLIGGVASFQKPLVMRPFESETFGPLYLGTMSGPMFNMLMRLKGIKDGKEFSLDDARAWVQLLKKDDNGKAFLTIMRCFEATKEKEALYMDALNGEALKKVPKQIIFGKFDSDLRKYNDLLKENTSIDRYFEVSGRHFLQEDCYHEIVGHFVDMIKAQ